MGRHAQHACPPARQPARQPALQPAHDQDRRSGRFAWLQDGTFRPDLGHAFKTASLPLTSGKDPEKENTSLKLSVSLTYSMDGRTGKMAGASVTGAAAPELLSSANKRELGRGVVLFALNGVKLRLPQRVPTNDEQEACTNRQTKWVVITIQYGVGNRHIYRQCSYTGLVISPHTPERRRETFLELELAED